MKISILGVGYVGAVSSGCLASLGHEVIAVDISQAKVAMLANGHSPIVEPEIAELIADSVKSGRLRATTDVREAVLNSDVSFISVGTPSASNGAVSMAAVDQVIFELGTAIREKSSSHVIVMRSTVPPGTAEKRIIPALEKASGKKAGDGFRYYSNPEFLREGSSVRDFYAPPFTLIGAAANDDAGVMREIYASIRSDFHIASFEVAESVKHLCNAFHAVKLAFANEAGAVLASCGVDAREAFQLFCQDRQLNISPAYLRPGFAFGGSCLPKDMRGLLALADGHEIDTPFLDSVLPGNQAVIQRAFDIVASQGRRHVALFGLAFKPGTDDLRESPFVTLAERLLGRGWQLSIFDRSVNIARLAGSNLAFIEKEIPHLDQLLKTNVAETLENAKIVVVGHISDTDRAALVGGLTNQFVLDLAGIDELRARAGITYQGFCW